MNDYEMDLIRHIVGKALYESDEIDCTELDTERIETALWATSGDAACGLHVSHPKTRDIYGHREMSETVDQPPTDAPSDGERGLTDAYADFDMMRGTAEAALDELATGHLDAVEDHLWEIRDTAEQWDADNGGDGDE